MDMSQKSTNFPFRQLVIAEFIHHPLPGGVCILWYLLGCPPLPVIVATRIVVFLIGDPNLNLHLPLASWEGGQPKVFGKK